MATEDEVVAALTAACLSVVGRKQPSPGQTQLAVDGLDAVVNLWTNGTCNTQGREAAALADVLGDLVRTARRRSGFEPPATSSGSAKAAVRPTDPPRVFVVYGHDKPALDELEAILRRWGLEPLILQNLASGGSTIIEKLEQNMTGAEFAVVLMTPDDLGHPALDPTKAAPRPRQNVVMEFGMLLGKLGRARVAVLYKRSHPQMEPPSDMSGYIYLGWSASVSETRTDLAREMAASDFFDVPARNL